MSYGLQHLSTADSASHLWGSCGDHLFSSQVPTYKIPANRQVGATLGPLR
jgi:hypothetical protein